MNRFAGRRALITGAAQGIGEAIARRLAEEGATVIVADRDGEAAELAASTFGGIALALDVSDHDRTRAAVVSVGRLDVLVNNAGIDDFGWFTETTYERWRRLIAVNLEGALTCTYAALPAMRDAGYGRILNITSEAARIGSKGNAVYAATKGALISFTKSLARENARAGITVNALAPGPIETTMLEANRQLPNGQRMVAAMIAGTQLGRLGVPREVAAAAAFLTAEEASFITGETLGVSGGMGLGG
jgi:2-hydroxycyclohexanecarboxyl-CoA dehydrogenase